MVPEILIQEVIKMNDKPKFAEWLEITSANLAGLNPESVCLVGRTEGGIFTGYFNASVEDLAVCASRLQAEITMNTIKANAKELKELLADCK